MDGGAVPHVGKTGGGTVVTDRSRVPSGTDSG